jgi:hypothetical protein
VPVVSAIRKTIATHLVLVDHIANIAKNATQENARNARSATHVTNLTATRTKIMPLRTSTRSITVAVPNRAVEPASINIVIQRALPHVLAPATTVAGDIGKRVY